MDKLGRVIRVRFNAKFFTAWISETNERRKSGVEYNTKRILLHYICPIYIMLYTRITFYAIIQKDGDRFTIISLSNITAPGRNMPGEGIVP